MLYRYGYTGLLTFIIIIIIKLLSVTEFPLLTYTFLFVLAFQSKHPFWDCLYMAFSYFWC